MIINNNFLQCILLFFTEKFCLKFNNLLKICLRCVMKPKQINKYNIFVTFSQFEFRFIGFYSKENRSSKMFSYHIYSMYSKVLILPWFTPSWEKYHKSTIFNFYCIPGIFSALPFGKMSHVRFNTTNVKSWSWSWSTSVMKCCVNNQFSEKF